MSRRESGSRVSTLTAPVSTRTSDSDPAPDDLVAPLSLVRFRLCAPPPPPQQYPPVIHSPVGRSVGRRSALIASAARCGRPSPGGTPGRTQRRRGPHLTSVPLGPPAPGAHACVRWDSVINLMGTRPGSGHKPQLPMYALGFVPGRIGWFFKRQPSLAQVMFH